MSLRPAHPPPQREQLRRRPALIKAYAGSWRDNRYPSAISLGDTDGDGRGEIAIGRHAKDNMRWFLRDDLCPGQDAYVPCTPGETDVDEFQILKQGGTQGSHDQCRFIMHLNEDPMPEGFVVDNMGFVP